MVLKGVRVTGGSGHFAPCAMLGLMVAASRPLNNHPAVARSGRLSGLAVDVIIGRARR
jgi:hypothetical protein